MIMKKQAIKKKNLFWALQCFHIHKIRSILAEVKIEFWHFFLFEKNKKKIDRRKILFENLYWKEQISKNNQRNRKC